MNSTICFICLPMICQTSLSLATAPQEKKIPFFIDFLSHPCGNPNIFMYFCIIIRILRSSDINALTDTLFLVLSHEN